MVYIKKCETYDEATILSIIDAYFNEFDIYDKLNDSTRVFVKLNCVGPFDKDMGITTHPAILKAVLDILKKYTNNIIVGDNPAIRDLIPTLKKCGLYDVITNENVKILEGKEFTTITNSKPRIYSKFEVSKQMIDCDVLINLPKIKTHSLTYMTCAQKNFFGLIYGLNKSAWHTKASNPLEFGEALNDLYGAFLESFKDKTVLHIADGIIGLEGEGPSSCGKAKSANCLIASTDAIALDRVALELVHLDYSKLYVNQIAAQRGYGEASLDKIEIKGNSLSDFDDIHFEAPKDSIGSTGIRFLRFKFVKNLLLEHPHIQKDKCIKCGQCATICPAKTLKIEKGEYPHLKVSNCIRCWCCAEVCPQNAINKSKRPLFGRIILKTDK